MTEETLLWKGSPSQWLNLGPFFFSLVVAALIVAGSLILVFPLLLAALVLPLGYMLWKFLVVRNHVFELTNQRLRMRTGVFNHMLDEVELYRVKDSMMLRPWWMRATGLSSIRLETSDRTLPELTIPAISDGEEVREELRKRVESERDRKRVREMDFDDSGDMEIV